MKTDFEKFVSRKLGVAGGGIAAILLAIPTPDPVSNTAKIVCVAVIAVAYIVANAMQGTGAKPGGDGNPGDGGDSGGTPRQ